MTYLTNKVSGFKTAILKSLVPNITSSTAHFKYNSSEIPVDFGVTSSDNHIFNFSQGSSYFVFASNSFDYTSRTSKNFSFGFINTDTNVVEGTKGQCTASRVSSDGYRLYPQYTRFCALFIKENTIPNSGLNIAVRLIEGLENYETLGDLTSSYYRWDVLSGTGSGVPEKTFGYPTMTIFKTDN